ncbi:MAG: hypothetical protein IJS60_10725, partial [Abditibacteriota bacterium]|nr:hypothetical protein [Abditibacteriota bacterium]
MNLAIGFTVFFVLGYVLNKIQIRKTVRYILYALIPISYLLTSFLTYHYSKEDHAFLFISQENSLTILVFSLGIFILFKYTKCFNKENRLVPEISKNVFGIYLFHN